MKHLSAGDGGQVANDDGTANVVAAALKYTGMNNITWVSLVAPADSLQSTVPEPHSGGRPHIRLVPQNSHSKWEAVRRYLIHFEFINSLAP